MKFHFGLRVKFLVRYFNLIFYQIMFFFQQAETVIRPPFLSVSVAWLTFACTFCLSQAAPTALNSKHTAAALSAATVAAAATAVLSTSGVVHAAYALVPVLVATHSMVPTHVAVACFATAAMVAVHIVSSLAEIQWTPNAEHVKQVNFTKKNHRIFLD